jgi:ring-1,2-phenylacetyl-CoA epoxidase subunit PaaC
VRTEDDLAYLRDEPDFTCALLVQAENGDFGRTMARQLLVSAYQLPLWDALSRSGDEVLAGVAGKAVKEAAYHLDHARSWVVRLGDGTDESHRRVQAGLDAVWPYAFELFERDPLVERLVDRGIAADPDLLRPQWEAHVADALAEATLAVPETTWRPTGGRSGRHLTCFGHLLAELQHLHRSHPGASW